ncbi:hypothetical protein PTSG_10976 [Salpingoeca rosetta]|uniref:Uncharacterized protein n=1 Tax=Salpingoeca rosetta (strain ATCC 50818 / BSB-021) TaxID=946362 RepID=F2USC4_SALR5|nr:uncharacterized protein PTSG_10976 [Salpingoeca rosetta]EGD81033.1 hypothetical protein PTSG_10976 [Salpingoeca rosetta]|eukprot:XP_004987903.1 hypothetical protein PTSG_10976 [Salpingoeca rosetta]
MNRRWRRNKQRRERYRQQQEALSPRVRAEIRQVNRSAAKRYREEVHKRTRAWYVELQRTRARNLQLRRRAKAVSRQLRDLMLQVTDSAATLLPLVQRLKQAPGKQHRDHHQQQQAVPEHTSQQQQQPTTATASRSEVDNIDDDDNSDNEDDALVPKGMEGTGQHRLARVLAAADAAANLDTGSADDSSSPGSDDGDDGDDDDDDTGDEGGDGVTLTRGSSAMGFPSATSPLAGIGADRQTAKSAKAVHLLHRNGHACAAGSSPTRGHPASLNPSSSPTSSAVTPAGHQSRAFAVPLQAQLPCAPPSTVIRAHQSYLQPFAMFLVGHRRNSSTCSPCSPCLRLCHRCISSILILIISSSSNKHFCCTNSLHSRRSGLRASQRRQRR